MSHYAARHLLDIWERAREESHLTRALTLVSDSGLIGTPEHLPIGDRDRLLLNILTENFGGGIEAVADCPACGAVVEITFDAARLTDTTTAQNDLLIPLRGQNYRLRLPSSSDIAASIATEFPARALALRCLSGDFALDALSDDDVDRIGEALVAAEPLLDPRIALSCPECGAEQEHGFDIAAFLWDKIEARARRVLAHVHLLARAYGWSEADILALPDARRAAYLDMVMS